MMVLATSTSYHYPDTYSVAEDVDEDDEDSSEEKPQREDYTKYFGGSGSGTLQPHSTAQTAADSSAGFVEPIDFSQLFSVNNFGSPDAVRGVIAPPTTRSLFGGSSGTVLPGMIPGLLPGLAPSATQHNHSSLIGFVHPNPNIAFQALVDSNGSPSGSLYQQQNFFNPYLYPRNLNQPATSHSQYLPRFEVIKGSVTRDVAEGQRQAAQATRNARNKKKSPLKQGKDAYYDATSYPEKQESNANDDDDGDDDEDDEDSDDSNEGDDDDGSYSYEEADVKPPQRQGAPSEPHPGKSSYPNKQKSHHLKVSPFKNPYPYKPSKVATSETRQKNRSDVKQQSPYKREPISPGSIADYPRTGLDDEKDFTDYDSSPFKSVNEQNMRPLNTKRNQKNMKPALFTKSKEPTDSRSYQTLNAAHNHPSYTPVGQSIYPAFVLTHGKVPPHQKNIPSASSIYSYNPRPLSPVTLHGDFVPSASIPFTENYPRAYKIPYSDPVTKSEIPSSVLPSNPLIKADSSEMAKSTKRCTKIEKDVNPGDVKAGRVRRQPMTCYKCQDVATGANYEQCSYDSESKPKAFHEKESQKIKIEKTVKPHTFRKKRDLSENPYDFSFSRDMNVGQSVTLVRKVRQYTEYDDSYETPYGTSDEENYRFGPEYFKEGSDDEEGESSQEVPESENGEQCRKVKKDGIICMVCEKPSGGSYEQCSYASDPNKSSYSYGTSRTYGTGSRPQKKRNRRYSGIFEHETSGKINKLKSLHRKVRQNPNSSKRLERNKKDSDEESFENPEDFSESKTRIRKADKKGGVGLDPFFYGSPEDTFHEEELDSQDKKQNEDEEGGSDEQKSASSQESESSPTYEDYFARLFPELSALGSEKREAGEAKEEDYDSSENTEDEDGAEEETKQPRKKLIPGFEFQSSIPEYFDDTEQRKDLEKVLGEFTQKDRSSCKKVMRDKMTCYQCLDEKGMQHEECMFVAASEPKSKHLAYHEVKQFRLTPNKKQPEKNIDDKLASRKPLTFDNPVKETDPSYEASEENENLKNKRKIGTQDNSANEPNYYNSESEQIDNDSQPAENHDIMRLHPKESKKFPVSTVTIQNQRFFSSTGSSKPEEGTRRRRMTALEKKKRLPDEDMKAVATRRHHRRAQSDTEEDYEDEAAEKSNVTESPKKPYNPIPTDPPNFNIPEGPEGAYSEDTEPAFDTVLKITLPRYMLEKSEHEAIFDEVLASG